MYVLNKQASRLQVDYVNSPHPFVVTGTVNELVVFLVELYKYRRSLLQSTLESSLKGCFNR